MADHQRAAQLAATVLVLQAGDAMMSRFAPNLFTVRSATFNGPGVRAGNARAVREGYTAAAALTLAIGAVAAVLVRSPLPVLAAVLISAAEGGGYEYALAHPADTAADDSAPAWLPWGGGA